MSSAADHEHDLVDILGGTFTMGTDEPYRYPGDGEGPAREVTLRPYRIGAYAVTNRQFGAFVDATGHRTEAEHYGWSFVFHLFLPDDFPDTRAVAATPWWRQVYGADWAHPAGPQSNVDDSMEHPVVHVSWNDARSYCEWASVRLPTEAEWEMAARGGLVQKRFVWGDELQPKGRPMCNIFEGEFPSENTAEDGYVGTAPVDAFPPNGFGLHNMAGNVWEWCSDWFHATHHADGPRKNPQGPPAGEAKVMRGGSYLCNDSYCHRYRVAARSSNTADSSTGNLGFRVAADPPA
jgi:formylglycine-generating enzyme required for sulfatase activity